MKTYSQEDIEITIANAKKPLSFSSITYPLKELDDRLFEILIYSLFKKKIENSENPKKELYDRVVLMPGVGDRGMDCAFLLNDKVV